MGHETVLLTETDAVVAIALLDDRRVLADAIDGFPEGDVAEIEGVNLLRVIGPEIDLEPGLPGDLVEDLAEVLVGKLEVNALEK